MSKVVVLLWISVCAFVIATRDANGQDVTQGSLFAHSKDGVDLGACPLERTQVNAAISGSIARVTVVQEFENSFDEPIEAVYTFPLPNDSAVDDMKMKIGDRTILGKILRKEEARRVYDSAKEEGKTAALLDQERPNIFTQSVANISRGEKVYIEISYVQPLRFEDGSYEFVFPMTITPRYNPAGSDAENVEKISPPVMASRNGHDISINVTLNAGVPIQDLRSNTHAVKTINLTPATAQISLQNETTIPNKDFVLRYDVTGQKIEDSVLATGRGTGGFFGLFLSPPDRMTSADVSPKEIVFVLDTSGSMGGFPIEKAKEAMKLAIDGLYPEDTFNLITFSGDTHILFDRPVPATKANLDKAQEFLAGRTGGGGTEMMAAVKAALAPSGSQDHIRIVCFMTDGAVGNDMEIIAEVRKHPRARVFAFGIGSSTNRFLLDSIAREGRGEVEYVGFDDDGSAAARRFHERIRNPYLTDISIDWGGLPVTEIYPKRIPDLFGAKQVVIIGRYSAPVSGKIALKGKVGGMPFERIVNVDLRGDANSHSVLASLWARTKVEELMSRSWDPDEEMPSPTQAIRNQITKLGIEYRLMTQYTSFVAVEERIVTRVRNGRRVRVPVYAPAGTVFADEAEGEGDGNGRSTGSFQSAALYSPSGAFTVSSSGSGSGAGYGSAAPPPPPPAPGKMEIIANLQRPSTVSLGVMNGQATTLAKPSYPPSARTAGVTGTVSVQVTVDESGKVIAAAPVAGPPLLRKAAQDAALASTFTPTMLSGQAVRTVGVIHYNFSGPGATPKATLVSSGIEIGSNDANVQPTPEMLADKRLKETLHNWLYEIVVRLRQNQQIPGPNEAAFVEGDLARVVVRISAIGAGTIEKLKAAGLEIASIDGREVAGKVRTDRLAELAAVPEITVILPRIKQQ